MGLRVVNTNFDTTIAGAVIIKLSSSPPKKIFYQDDYYFEVVVEYIEIIRDKSRWNVKGDIALEDVDVEVSGPTQYPCLIIVNSSNVRNIVTLRPV